MPDDLPYGPMPHRNVSLEEVYRTLINFRDDLKEDVGKLEKQIERLDYVPASVYEAEKRAAAAARVAIGERVQNLESTNRWLVRTVAGTLIGLVGAILAAVQIGVVPPT